MMEGRYFFTPLEEFTKLNLSAGDIANKLRQFLLSREELYDLGFPVTSTFPKGKAFFYIGSKSKYPNSKRTVNKPKSLLNANAAVFIPSVKEEVNNTCTRPIYQNPNIKCVKFPQTPPKSSLNVNSAVYMPSDIINQKPSIERVCARCDKSFFVTYEGEYLTLDQCTYHWGKLNQGYPYPVYTCCGGSSSSKGCCTSKLHVWNGYIDGMNGPFEGYVCTHNPKTPPRNGDYGVYGLDCEMCFTADGLDLSKVTIVKADGRIVYHSFVKPDKEIIDYNSRFSGITPETFRDPRFFKSLKEVQMDLLKFINAKSILIGHSLNNDLRALKMIHTQVIDTSVLFPHPLGLPYRQSLKKLASLVLGRSIQQNSSGHDSIQDARASLELALYHIGNTNIFTF